MERKYIHKETRWVYKQRKKLLKNDSCKVLGLLSNHVIAWMINTNCKCTFCCFCSFSSTKITIISPRIKNDGFCHALSNAPAKCTSWWQFLDPDQENWKTLDRHNLSKMSRAGQSGRNESLTATVSKVTHLLDVPSWLGLNLWALWIVISSLRTMCDLQKAWTQWIIFDLQTRLIAVIVSRRIHQNRIFDEMEDLSDWSRTWQFYQL